MREWDKKFRVAAVSTFGMVLGTTVLLARAQMSLPARPILSTDAVQFLSPEQLTVTSGKSTTVTLHFRIAQGLHINSHTPREDYLIPTALTIPETSGVRLDSASYPPGEDVALPVDPKTKLSVYTGDFSIEAHIVATPGNHPVEAKLRYQACDNNECMPPKTISVTIDVVGK